MQRSATRSIADEWSRESSESPFLFRGPHTCISWTHPPFQIPENTNSWPLLIFLRFLFYPYSPVSMNSGLILYCLSALRYLTVATKLETLHPPSLHTPLRVIFFKKEASVSTLRTNRMITCVSKCRILNKKIQLLANVYLLLVLTLLFNEVYSCVSYREINILANLPFIVTLSHSFLIVLSSFSFGVTSLSFWDCFCSCISNLDVLIERETKAVDGSSELIETLTTKRSNVVPIVSEIYFNGRRYRLFLDWYRVDFSPTRESEKNAPSGYINLCSCFAFCFLVASSSYFSAISPFPSSDAV